MVLDNLKIVLVETSHPGNIGASARAMKTMGLRNLVMVKPKYFPHPEAIAMASGAEDILQNAEVVDNLAQAVADCHWVIGTTARPRDLAWPMFTPRTLITELKSELKLNQQIAIVFGRERTGLSNEELWLCQAGLTIPTHPSYHSLNLSQAVQIMAYELYQNFADCSLEMKNTEQVNAAALEQFFQHLQQVLILIGFMSATEPKRLMPKLKRLFHRAKIEVSEMNILRGILTQIQQVKGSHEN